MPNRQPQKETSSPKNNNKDTALQLNPFSMGQPNRMNKDTPPAAKRVNRETPPPPPKRAAREDSPPPPNRVMAQDDIRLIKDNNQELMSYKVSVKSYVNALTRLLIGLVNNQSE